MTKKKKTLEKKQASTLPKTAEPSLWGASNAKRPFIPLFRCSTPPISTPRLRGNQKMPFVFPPSSSLAAFLNKPLSLLCVAFLIEAAGLTPKAEFYGRERCSVGSTTIAAQSTVEFPGTVIWEVPHRTTPIQFFRELEKRLRVKHRIYITACHIRSAIHSKFRNLGDSIPIKQLTKGMSETGSLLDGVQLAETLGTPGVISHQVSVLWGTVKHIRQGSRGISLLHSSGRSNAPSDVQQAVSRLGMSVRNLSLYTPAGKGRFFFPTVEERANCNIRLERASYKDSVDRENACSDACIGESSSASLKVSFTEGRKDPYDHIGSIAEKVFLSWTRSQGTAIFLLRTQRLTKKMGNHPHEDQKTQSNALKSPKDLFTLLLSLFISYLPLILHSKE
ncbi:hypothetical protein ACOSQ3_023018 [Xanthoceras sorbifolium]